MKRQPTKEFYEMFQEIYNHFNKKLFDSTLPNCLISIQRKNGTMGYFSQHRFIHTDGSKTHEIAMNPTYFAKQNIIEIFQTLVHEMCHLWQFEHGVPSQKSYHNKEWSRKMEKIGLMPSSTGEKGGKKTGQNMSDYPIIGGDFEKESKKLLENKLFVQWFDRYSIGDKIFDLQNNLAESTEQMAQGMTNINTNGIELIPINSLDSHTIPVKQVAKNKSKTKYICACKNALWGKPKLYFTCDDCGERYKCEE